MVSTSSAIAIAVAIAIAGCSSDDTPSEGDAACSDGEVVIEACECSDSPLVGSRRCVDGEWQSCACPYPSDAAVDDDANQAACTMAGEETECWRALAACFPAGETRLRRHVEAVCSTLCGESPVAGTTVSCETECGTVSIDLGFCEQSCADIAASAPAVLDGLCPGS